MRDDKAHRGYPPLLVTGKRPDGRASYNMALDEVLFEASRALDRSIWRLYLWSPPAVSIGRNQRVRETVNLETLEEDGIEMVRRPTGGRAIWHYGDVCFTHCGRSPSEGESMSAFKDDYMRTADALIRFFAELGISARISPGQVSTGAIRGGYKSPCFMSSGRYEITIGSKKIAGIAQYRSNGRYLIQGSVRLSAVDSKNAELFFRQGGVALGLFREFAASISSIEEEIGGSVAWVELRRAFMRAIAAQENDVVEAENPGSIFDVDDVIRLERDKYTKTFWNERF